jgi:hypothetical protein
MSAAIDLIREAKAVGIRMFVTDKGTLQLQGQQKPDADLLKRLKRHRDEIIRHLGGEQTPTAEERPFIKDGELRIPFGCVPKYKWWAGGQSIFETLLELNAPDEVIEKYIGPVSTPAEWEQYVAMKNRR